MMSRDDIVAGTGRRSASAAISARSADATSGSWVTTTASQVRSKHLRVKLQEATMAGPSSATRYLAWYFTTGSLYAWTEAPHSVSRFQSFLSFSLPPLARAVISASILTPREV